MRTLLAAAVAALALPAAAQPITGTYDVEGTNFDGSPYSGEATITALSDVSCAIVWVTGPTTSDGICMRDGPVVAAGYRLGDAVGLIIYRQAPDGRLVGTWTLAGSDGVGTEVLTPR